jgi:putative transposase
MPRQARHAPGDLVYHVLNRAAGGMKLFRGSEDYAAFLRVLAETMEQIPMRVCGYCLMGTHWHLILWPKRDGELPRFMQRLTITHVRRWVEHRHRVGMGSVYQGRYKSFPVQDDPHLSTLARYVERNPLRANLVERAEQWRWSSLGQAFFDPSKKIPRTDLTPLPLTGIREDWVEWINLPQTVEEERAIAHSITHSRPLGGPEWTRRMEKRLGLGPLRPRGRPEKSAQANGTRR